MPNDQLNIFKQQFLKHPFIIARNTCTYEELYHYIIQISENFSKLSLQKGDRVALMNQDKNSTILILLAAIHYGLIVVPLNNDLPEKILFTTLSQINCRFVITDEKNNSKTKYLNIIIHPEQLLEAYKFYPKFDQLFLSLDIDCSIIFTSGSGAIPKAVLHTFKNHYFSALGSNLNLPFSIGDRWLLSLPLYHVSGFSIIIRALISGGSLVIPDAGIDLIDNIKKFKITHLSLVPTQLIQILDDKSAVKILKTLKAILIGGGYIPESLISRSIDHDLPIRPTYGSTEMASQITTTRTKENRNNLYTCGKPLKYNQIKVTKENEIIVKGQSLFKGYLNKDQLNKPFDNNGWFRTGDVGSIDKFGYLSIRGRKDNMFISGGENIYPEEIEKHILNIKSVLNALVFDIPHEKYIARPVALIRFKDEKRINKDNIIKHLRSHMLKFKIPDAFYKWPEDLYSFKPNRRELRKRFKELNLDKID